MNNEYISERVTTHEETLYGKNGSMGLVQKVSMIWKSYIWLLCSLSAILGFVLRPVVLSLFNHI